MPTLRDCFCTDLSAYYEHLADRVRRAARAAGDDLWTKPFAYGNSVGHLVLHITGNLNHYIGARIAETGDVRQREREFTEPSRPTLDALLEQFDAAITMVRDTLAGVDESRLTAVYPGSDTDSLERTHLGMFILCAAHMNNHIGQLAYLLQELQGDALDPPVW